MSLIFFRKNVSEYETVSWLVTLLATLRAFLERHLSLLLYFFFRWFVAVGLTPCWQFHNSVFLYIFFIFHFSLNICSFFISLVK